ncbi:hypothetical protein AKJ16_DCAP11777 [Drosera capensis]
MGALYSRILPSVFMILTTFSCVAKQFPMEKWQEMISESRELSRTKIAKLQKHCFTGVPVPPCSPSLVWSELDKVQRFWICFPGWGFPQVGNIVLYRVNSTGFLSWIIHAISLKASQAEKQTHDGFSCDGIEFEVSWHA